MLVFQDLEGLTEVFGRISTGTSGRKLPLWGDFLFLNKGSHTETIHTTLTLPMGFPKRGGTLTKGPVPTSFHELVFLSRVRGLQMGGQIRRGRIWRFWGAPIFSSEVPKYLFLKGFWGLWTENRGAPKTPNSTTTMTQHCDPPYRAIGYSYTYRIYVFYVSQGIALFPPLLGVSQNYVKGRGGEG